jgi:hypothetical protein
MTRAQMIPSHEWLVGDWGGVLTGASFESLDADEEGHFTSSFSLFLLCHLGGFFSSIHAGSF